ncbi:MAG: sulfate ABC transporter permease [Nonlabens sp.]
MTTRNFWLAFFTLFTVSPVLLGFLYALLYSVGLIGLMNDGFTLEYWTATLTTPSFWSALGYSFYISLTVMIFSISMALFMVISWYKDLQKGWLSYVVYLPLAFPGVVLAFYGMQLFSKGGFLSRLTIQLGLIEQLGQFPDLVNDSFGISIIIMLCCIVTPFFTILFSNLFQSENITELHHLARTLGAQNQALNWQITIPLLLRRATFNIILFFIFIMGTYEIPLLLGRQDPSMLSPLVIQKLQKFNLADIPQAYSISVIYMLLVFTALVVLYRSQPQLFNSRRS